MRTLILALGCAFAFTSCVDNSTNTNTNAVLDPVCNMAKDDTWTETSQSHGETFYFCSPVCKETFDKNPHKFMPDHKH